jgi:hypothetical protein
VSLIKKIWRGDRESYPRWKDEKGNFVGSRRLIMNGSRAVVTGVARIALGMRPGLPWISYDAILTWCCSKAHLSQICISYSSRRKIVVLHFLHSIIRSR